MGLDHREPTLLRLTRPATGYTIENHLPRKQLGHVTVALKGELRSSYIPMGDDTPDAYFSKIDVSFITLLTEPWLDHDNRNNRIAIAVMRNKTEICSNYWPEVIADWGMNCLFHSCLPKAPTTTPGTHLQHNVLAPAKGSSGTHLVLIQCQGQQHLSIYSFRPTNLLAQYGLSIVASGSSTTSSIITCTMGALRPNGPSRISKEKLQQHQPTFGFKGYQQALLLGCLYKANSAPRGFD
ncbi:hypothetical protein Tco_0585943 [Tanacetum coccineum]